MRHTSAMAASISGGIPSMPRNDNAYIVNTLIPEIIKRTNLSFQHYGDTYKELGVQGQFSDIWRKVGPLKRALWEGKELPGESPREICMDLIGHCLLTVALLDEESGR